MDKLLTAHTIFLEKLVILFPGWFILLDAMRERIGARRQGKPRMAWMDDINMWTGLPMKESVRMTEDRDKWRNYVRDVANPRIEDG